MLRFCSKYLKGKRLTKPFQIFNRHNMTEPKSYDCDVDDHADTDAEQTIIRGWRDSDIGFVYI